MVHPLEIIAELVLFCLPSSQTELAVEPPASPEPSLGRDAAQKLLRLAKKWWLCFAVLAGLLLPLVLLILYYGFFSFPGLAAMVASALGVVIWAALAGTLNEYKRFARNLMQQEDIQSIGSLLEVLEFQGGLSLWSRDLRKEAVITLICLLPRLGASDYLLLTPSQRRIWYRALIRQNSLEFAAASLPALAQVGDRKAIPVVMRLAARYPGLRQEADACLEAIKQSEYGGTAERLLRAAPAPEDPAHTLLRSAGQNKDGNTSFLLRPAQQTQNKARQRHE
jgi:hypothetical protein